MLEPVAGMPEPGARSLKPVSATTALTTGSPGVQRPPRYRSLDELIARTGLRRDEVVTLADIGALNSFGYDRRSALWQAERAVRPAGELFNEAAEHAEHAELWTIRLTRETGLRL